MPTPHDDELLARLARLPAADVDARVREAQRARALALLAARAPRPGGLARAWDRVLEPALATAFVLFHLGWALSFVASTLGR